MMGATMQISLDDANPCVTAQALRLAYTKLVAGQTPSGVVVRGADGGVEKDVRFHAANPTALLREVQNWEAKCDAVSNKRRPRQRAIYAGGRPQRGF